MSGLNWTDPGLCRLSLMHPSPIFTLQRGKTKQVIKARGMQATFSLDDEKTMVSLTRLSLDLPKLDLAGKFVMDRKTSRVSLELEGRDLNMATAEGGSPFDRRRCSDHPADLRHRERGHRPAGFSFKPREAPWRISGQQRTSS